MRDCVYKKGFGYIYSWLLCANMVRLHRSLAQHRFVKHATSSCELCVFSKTDVNGSSHLFPVHEYLTNSYLTSVILPRAASHLFHLLI